MEEKRTSGEQPRPEYILLRGVTSMLAFIMFVLGATAPVAFVLVIGLFVWLINLALLIRLTLLMAGQLQLHDQLSHSLKRVYDPGSRNLQLAAPITDGIFCALAFASASTAAAFGGPPAAHASSAFAFFTTCASALSFA